ncbi:MAG: hypothetical protein ACLQVJ_13340 [Syntrophobacteraceae bacterium]
MIIFATGLRKMGGKQRRHLRGVDLEFYIGVEGDFSASGTRIEKESGSNTDLPILAGRLVAIAGGFGETVKVALLSLPFSIERSQSFLEAFCAKPMRVPIDVGVPASPCFMASNTLKHHKSFLVVSVSQK